MQPSHCRPERRVDCRYYFEQPLVFYFEQHRANHLGAGHTVELGGGGVLFQSDCPPPDGASVEVQIVWPFLMQGICSVALIIQGMVVRTDARGTAVRMRQYMFQTVDSLASECAINSGVACNLIG